MSARPHGTDGPDETDEPEPDETARPDEPDGAADDTATAAGTAPGASASALPPDEIDSRWSDIVTHLQAPADPRAWAPDPEVEEAEDHFVPPEPAPVLGGDPLLTMAWAAVVAFPVLVVVVVLAWRDAPTWVLVAAGAVFLAGAGLLVWRMPHERDPDDSDPGAVV